MNNKRGNEVLDTDADDKVSAKIVKLSDTADVIACDLYQFIREEQPFTFVSVPTDCEAAKKMREKISSMMEVGNEFPLEKQVQFHIELEHYMLHGEDNDDDYSDDVKKVIGEIRDIVGDRSKWRVVLKEDWAPIVISMKIENLLVLNTWC